MNTLNLNHIPKEVFNYKKYLEFMENKKVRFGKDRTNTLLDFVSEEQRLIDKENYINDLSIYDPTPENIQTHFNFVKKVYNELIEKYPNDEYLKSLSNSESMVIEKFSTDWYKKYRIEK